MFYIHIYTSHLIDLVQVFIATLHHSFLSYYRLTFKLKRWTKKRKMLIKHLNACVYVWVYVSNQRSIPRKYILYPHLTQITEKHLLKGCLTIISNDIQPKKFISPLFFFYCKNLWMCVRMCFILFWSILKLHERMFVYCTILHSYVYNALYLSNLLSLSLLVSILPIIICMYVCLSGP